MEPPLVSILIPIRNEAAFIERCLDAVLAQDYPHNRMEVLIADGMSDDGSRELLHDLKKKVPIINLFDNPEQIVSCALNRLTAHAKGEILIRVDGHCSIASDYVRNCVHHLQTRHIDGVGGPMLTVGQDHVSQVIAIAMSSKFGVGGSSFRTETSQTKLVDTVPFPAYTRDIIEKVGPYDEALVRNQDDEYNYRIRKAGGKLLLAANVRSTYYSRGSLRALWRQYFQYGFYKVPVFQKHPGQMSPRQFIPPIFVLALLSGFMLTLLVSWGWLALLVLTGLYLLVNLGASVAISHQRGWRYFWLLPVAHAVLHLSYGLGFLVGLVKFWNRWRVNNNKLKGES